jgi:hypothetical protein
MELVEGKECRPAGEPVEPREVYGLIYALNASICGAAGALAAMA